MATLNLQNESLASVEAAAAEILAGAPMSPGYPANAYFDSFAVGSQTVILNGNGLTFNSNGVLAGGTITGLGEFDNTAANFSLSNLQLSFSDFTNLASGASFEPSLLAGNDAITLTNNTGLVDGYGGNDVFTIGGGPLSATSATLDGGTGSNTVNFLSLRSDASITDTQPNGTASPDSFQVTANGGAYSTANVSAANVSVLQFLDGATYSDSSSTGGQVALMFNALLGRTPEASALGFYANYANTAGTIATGDAIIATAEGQADTSGLSNAAFVARMYQYDLGRAPDASGEAYWQGGLDNGTFTRGGVAAGIAGSGEALADSGATLGVNPEFGSSPTATLVDQIYQTLTAQLPSDALLQSGIAALTGGTTAAQLATSVIGSSAYTSEYGTPSLSSFVASLQTNVNGAVDPNAVAYWVNTVNNGSLTQGQVAIAYAQSPIEMARLPTLASETGVAHT